MTKLKVNSFVDIHMPSFKAIRCQERKYQPPCLPRASYALDLIRLASNVNNGRKFQDDGRRKRSYLFALCLQMFAHSVSCDKSAEKNNTIVLGSTMSNTAVAIFFALVQ